jgi:hypothetical protein
MNSELHDADVSSLTAKGFEQSLAAVLLGGAVTKMRDLDVGE